MDNQDERPAKQPPPDDIRSRATTGALQAIAGGATAVVALILVVFVIGSSKQG